MIEKNFALRVARAEVIVRVARCKYRRGHGQLDATERICNWDIESM